MKRNKSYEGSLLVLFLALLTWSALGPASLKAWVGAAAPAIIGITVLIATYRKFRFTQFVYTIIFIHTVIVLIGAHYTYANMPLFDWFKQVFSLQRNYYDRVGHFIEGFSPVLVARELLIRNQVINNKRWMYLILISIALAIAVVYEFIEWVEVIAIGAPWDQFIQGDVWDTHWDMLMAFVGANMALIFFSKKHDQTLKTI